ncbi:MAG: hypothetical protein HC880_18235 [Bacteroidia bacterium]|nr:hypothetical protein [Bacteroidia bacterium]
MPVTSAFAAYEVVRKFAVGSLNVLVEMELGTASLCGLNVLCDQEGKGGLFITWSGDVLNVDGVHVPIPKWKTGELLRMQIFIDQKLVEVFINGGRYCVSRQVKIKT